MRKVLLFSLAALLVAVGAQAQYVGGNPWKGNESGEPTILYDGTNRQWWRGDASGIGRITEEYPEQLQSTNTVIAADSSRIYSNAPYQLGNFIVSAAQYTHKQLRVTTVSTTATPVRLYLYSSQNGSTVAPVYLPASWLGTTIDTVKVSLPATIGTRTYVLPLPPEISAASPYIGVYARSDTIAGVTVKASARLEGRW